MNNLKFDSLINLKLTQESGQTSQSPWKYNSVGNTDEFSELIYLKVPSIIDVLNDETINLNKLPVLLKLSQDKTNYNQFTYLYKFPKKVEKKDFSINAGSFSKNEIKIIEDEIKKELSKIYDLDFNLEKFYKFLSDDEKLAPSVDFCNGLRLFIGKGSL